MAAKPLITTSDATHSYALVDILAEDDDEAARRTNGKFT
jgi:hypothetical protein